MDRELNRSLIVLSECNARLGNVKNGEPKHLCDLCRSARCAMHTSLVVGVIAPVGSVRREKIFFVVARRVWIESRLVSRACHGVSAGVYNVGMRREYQNLKHLSGALELSTLTRAVAAVCTHCWKPYLYLLIVESRDDL